MVEHTIPEMLAKLDAMFDREEELVKQGKVLLHQYKLMQEEYKQLQQDKEMLEAMIMYQSNKVKRNGKHS